MQILWNADEEEHAHAIRGLFEGARHIDCAVAFATAGGLAKIQAPLQTQLSRGMSARFIVSLDFFQTEPALLQALLNLMRKYKVEAFVRQPSPYEAFHPKIYRFEYDDQVAIIVGSANWTRGGLANNFECSTLLRLPEEEAVKRHLDQLVLDMEVVPLTAKIVSDYRYRHAIARAVRATADKRISRLSREATGGIEALRLVLEELSLDKSESGFDALIRNRAESRVRAVKAIAAIIKAAPTSASKLRPLLVTLRECFGSGGLQRHVTTIAKRPSDLVSLLRVAQRMASERPAEAYAAMQTPEIARFGPNWITEVLHALNPQSFAVLNRNSASGLAIVGAVFPERPTRTNIGPPRYAEFCAAADDVRAKLRLRDLAELDVLLNHVYWHPDLVEDEQD